MAIGAELRGSKLRPPPADVGALSIITKLPKMTKLSVRGWTHDRMFYLTLNFNL